MLIITVFVGVNRSALVVKLLVLLLVLLLLLLALFCYYAFRRNARNKANKKLVSAASRFMTVSQPANLISSRRGRDNQFEQSQARA